MDEYKDFEAEDMVVTQNVDGFHQAAGSREVVELHGSEVHAICLNKTCRRRLEMGQLFEETAESRRKFSKICEIPRKYTKKRWKRSNFGQEKGGRTRSSGRKRRRAGACGGRRRFDSFKSYS